jgi:hypothetical protein
MNLPRIWAEVGDKWQVEILETESLNSPLEDAVS